MPRGQVGQAVVPETSLLNNAVGDGPVGMPSGQVCHQAKWAKQLSPRLHCSTTQLEMALSACHQAKWARPRVAPSRSTCRHVTRPSGPDRESHHRGRPVGMSPGQMGHAVVPEISPLLNKAVGDGPVGMPPGQVGQTGSRTIAVGLSACASGQVGQWFPRAFPAQQGSHRDGLSACHQAKWARQASCGSLLLNKAVIAVGLSARHQAKWARQSSAEFFPAQQRYSSRLPIGMPSGQVGQWFL